jgi:hypothetical protein
MSPRLGAKVTTLRIPGNLHRCIQFLIYKPKGGHLSLNLKKYMCKNIKSHILVAIG